MRLSWLRLIRSTCKHMVLRNKLKYKNYKVIYNAEIHKQIVLKPWTINYLIFVAKIYEVANISSLTFILRIQGVL